MSTEVLAIRPKYVDFHRTSEYDVRRTRMTSGVTKRRLLRQRPIHTIAWDFDIVFAEHAADPMQTFWEARKGSYEAFVIPSWGKDAVLTTAYTTDSSNFYINCSSRFCTDATLGTPYACVVRNYDTNVGTWAKLSTITLGSTQDTIGTVAGLSFDSALPVGTVVDIGYLVTFDSPTLDQQLRVRRVSSYQIKFREELETITS